MLYDLFLIVYLVGVVAGLALVMRKADIAWWKALVPFYNMVLWVKLCGKRWPWYIYLLIPGINIFVFLLLVAETARVFRRTNFFEQLLGIVLPFLYLPWLGGLSKAQYHDPAVDPPSKVSEGRDWAEAIVFAVVAAIIIRSKVFELYSIPSSSMEGSLLTGDHLLVSKMAYGPRPIMTPLSLPLMHNTLVGTGGKVNSYLSRPQLPYHRYWGYTSVKRYDAVVFNFPAGDTICTGYPTCLRTYYDLVDELGREAVHSGKAVDSLGNPVGKVVARPLDKRENYIKRCIGLPGETLEIRDREVYIDGQPIATPEHAQFTYLIYFNPSVIHPEKILEREGLSIEDIEWGYYQFQQALTYGLFGQSVPFPIPLDAATAQRLEGLKSVDSVRHVVQTSGKLLYGEAEGQGWTVDNYGPIHIPAKGEVVELNDSTLRFYRRVISVYEGNTLEVKDGKVMLNGQPASTYTFQQDYYWMMGDNRHNSQDSRYWGFVPEDHIAGKAKTVLFSWDKGRHKIRFGRTISRVK